MKHKPGRRYAPIMALAVLQLAACSGEPSTSDIKTIVDRELKPAAEMQAKMFSNLSGMMGMGTQQEVAVSLTDAKKIGCKEAGNSAYVCDVELVIQAGEKTTSKPIQMRLVKGSNGWMLTK